MIQLHSTPTSSIPLSPPTSPPVRATAIPAVEADGNASSTTPVTTFVDPPVWRPYRSHLARVVVSFPATNTAASPKPRRKSFSFGVGGGAADSTGMVTDQELVADEARVTVTSDNLEIVLSAGGSSPFVRPAGSNHGPGGQPSTDRPPLSPPSSPRMRKKRLSFANALPFFGKGGEQQKARSTGDDSALDLEEHPDAGPDGVRQLRMKTAEQAAVSAPATTTSVSMPVEGSVFAEADVSPAATPAPAASEWPLVVNGAPIAQITVPLSQLSHSAISMAASRAISAKKSAGTLTRTPATFTVNIPASEGAAGSSAMGKDVYEGSVTLRIEFQSAFSGDTEAQTLLQIVQLALDRLGIEASSSDGTDSSALKLTRTISRGLTGRRKSSAGEEGRPMMVQPTAEELAADHERDRNYWDAMRYQ